VSRRRGRRINRKGRGGKKVLGGRGNERKNVTQNEEALAII
jgi:hypothetical protein